MKKILILMLIFILSLSGCNMGGNDVAEPTPEPSPIVTSAPTDSPSEAQMEPPLC